MELWEIVLIGVALSMDAVAVGMADGMAEPAMPLSKHMAIAAAFGLFQFLMPLAGYYFGSVFASLVEKIAPGLSFALLAFIGGKAIVSHLLERRSGGLRGNLRRRRKKLGFAAVAAQAVATSMDALAVGVTFLAAETASALPAHVALCALVIGLVTFSLSAPAVFLGGKAGNRFSGGAEFVGGLVLVAIGFKILLESLV